MQIVVLDGHILNPGDLDWGPVAQLGEFTVYDTTDSSEVVSRSREADILLINKVRITDEILEQLPKLRYIGVFSTGYDTVDLDACARRGIPVCNVMAYGVDDIAQHAMALLLELCRRTTLHTESIRRGDWAESKQWCYWLHPPLCLTDLTMGVVGFGNLGRRVAGLAHAFGMHVLADNFNGVPEKPFESLEYVPLEDLFRRSDVISLHCPLTEESRHLVNAERLALMKRGAILINTARGPLLDEAAVAEALNSGQLGGLGVDVLSREPPAPDNPLLSTPNTLITPHIAWATARARGNIIRLTAENITAWRVDSPKNVVNAPELNKHGF